MALITCPECGNKISDKAESCPNCGLPSAYFPVADSAPKKPTNGSLLLSDYSDLNSTLISFETDWNKLFHANHYVAQSELKRLQAVYGEYYRTLKNKLVYQFVCNHAGALHVVIDILKRFLTRMHQLDKEAEIHNTNYVTRVLTNEKSYFDTILQEIDPKIQLDDEQRRAVVTDDDYCLLVAGAGAGKTTTMSAKVKYLVEKKHVRPEEIIVISFTNKAINELKDRINVQLKIPAQICTFHKFAFDLIRRFTTEPPELSMSPSNVINEVLEHSIFEDKQLMRNVVLFLGYYFNITEEVFKYDNLNQYHEMKAAQDYETLKSNLGGYVDKVAEQRKNKGTKTLNGEFLRSAQEVQIANFLYLNGLDYEYESVYPYNTPSRRKKYTPDFLITQGEHVAYLEHYALTEGHLNQRFSPSDIKKYERSIEDKRAIHRACKTTLLETWSAYFDKRPLVEHLREVLEAEGFILKPRDLTEVYQKIVDTSKDKYIWRFSYFLRSFIELYKTNGYDAHGFAILRAKTDNPRTLLFLDIAEQVYNRYQESLKAENKIDFADMINDAYTYLHEIEKQKIALPYRYIIIDEFQDIAKQRFNLTKRLSEVTNAKVVAVGDDWQSIYAFSGSDISLFTKFLELMGSGVQMQITHTYRNSQELIDIAGNFVQKNTSQIKKQLISPKHLENPIVVESYDDSTSREKNLASCVESFIGQIVANYGEDSSILLIGRYNFDMYKLCQTGLFTQSYSGSVQSTKYPNANITFMTAHSSKGLGFDNVIILNMQENKFGFPCQIEDDPIMKLVTVEDTTIPFAEERRLFYVALTRTKNQVFIPAPKNRPSRFLVELVKDYHLATGTDINMDVVDPISIRCPECGYPLKYEYNKNYGLNLWICTNEPEVCDFMTNDKEHKHDIFKCPKCKDGYMVVKMNKKNGDVFYGCTNYYSDIKCTNQIPLNSH